jgi:hypothetical protein
VKWWGEGSRNACHRRAYYQQAVEVGTASSQLFQQPQRSFTALALACLPSGYRTVDGGWVIDANSKLGGFLAFPRDYS